MASTYLKPSVIARMAVGLLYRELSIARTIWTDATLPAEFKGALDDTVNVRVPTRRAFKTRTLRAGTPISSEDSVEFKVPVKLTTDVYDSVPITDEELTLDIVNFATQVLNPQVTTVAEGIEDQVAAAITGATYANAVVDIDESSPYDTLVDVNKILNDKNVGKANRFLLVGSGVEALMLKDEKFINADNRGSEAARTAFEEAEIGRIAKFRVFGSNAIPEDEAYAYHRTAYAAAVVAPEVPRGATMGQRISGAEAQQPGGIGSFQGVGARWLMDYDYVNTTDRSLVNAWVGTAAVEDPDDPTDAESDSSLIRAVKLSLSGS
jgi:hypothetical protein